MPVRTSPVESWGSENITISANARASEVGGSEARRDRVGEDMGLKTGGWSPLADGWGCVRDYITPVLPSPTPAAVHSIMHHTPLHPTTWSPVQHVWPLGKSLPWQRPSHPASTTTLLASTVPRVLITTVALIWGSRRLQRWGKRESGRNCMSFKEKRGYVLLWRCMASYRKRQIVIIKIVEFADQYTKCFRIACLYFIFIKKRNIIFCI